MLCYIILQVFRFISCSLKIRMMRTLMRNLNPMNHLRCKNHQKMILMSSSLILNHLMILMICCTKEKSMSFCRRMVLNIAEYLKMMGILISAVHCCRKDYSLLNPKDCCELHSDKSSGWGSLPGYSPCCFRLNCSCLYHLMPCCYYRKALCSSWDYYSWEYMICLNCYIQDVQLRNFSR